MGGKLLVEQTNLLQRRISFWGSDVLWAFGLILYDKHLKVTLVQ